MSQMSGLAGDGGVSQAKPSNTGRAVMLLAIAVILGVALLHELDNGAEIPALATKADQPATQPVVVPSTSSTLLTARSPADVKVLVANGVGVAGAASKVAARLQPIGYQLAKPGNTVNRETASSVLYAAGYQAEAQAVATSLGITSTSVREIPNPSPVTDIQASSVVVIVGADLASETSGSQTQAGSTTSTLNPATNGPLTNTQSPTGGGTNTGTGTGVR